MLILAMLSHHHQLLGTRYVYKTKDVVTRFGKSKDSLKLNGKLSLRSLCAPDNKLILSLVVVLCLQPPTYDISRHQIIYPFESLQQLNYTLPVPSPWLCNNGCRTGEKQQQTKHTCNLHFLLGSVSASSQGRVSAHCFRDPSKLAQAEHLSPTWQQNDTLSQSQLLPSVYQHIQQGVDIHEVLKSRPTFLESQGMLGGCQAIMLPLL